MITQEIIGLHHLHIVDLRSLQNFARAFRPGDVGTGPDFPPFAESALDTELRPDPQDQRQPDVE